MKKVISMTLALSLLLTGCGNFGSKDGSTNTKYASAVTVGEIKQKYGVDKEKDNAIMPMYNVENNKVFNLNFKTNMNEIKTSDVVSVHTDIKCLSQSEVLTLRFSQVNDGKTDVSVTPNCDVLASDKTLHNGGGVWGNAPIFYMRINYDMNSTTVKKLDKPVIIPFTIKSELPVPNLRKEISADGRFKLVWDKVEGAEKYKVYNVSRIDLHKVSNEPTSSAEEGYRQIPRLETTTTNTELEDFIIVPDVKTGSNIVHMENSGVGGDYYVTAVAGDKESKFSVPVSTPELSSQLPFRLHDDIFLKTFTDVSKLPKYAGVTFIDGSVQDREIIYRTDNIKINKYSSTQVDYYIKGTALKGYLNVEKINEEDIKSLNPEQKTDTTSGFVAPENNTDTVPSPDVPTIIDSGKDTKGVSKPSKDDTKNDSTANNTVDEQKDNTKKQVDEGNKEKVDTPTVVKDVKVNADNAFEEFLALKMVDAESEISLKAFPEAQNSKTLGDTIYKVVYQNPLILGVRNFSYDYSTLTLKVKYDDSSDVIKKKQQEIIAEAKKIVSSTIKSGMSDEEKRKALYDYLDKNSKYDDEALKNAEKNNYKGVDAKFNDSFNTYGIMVKKIGVCASYASTYKMLADLSGLDCIVVTGTIQNIPHAWNRVKVDNEWLSLDSTNNATNSGIPYMLYESNDETAKALTYVENKEYWLDSEITKFVAKSNKYDYYVANGLEVKDMSDYTTKLTALLKKGNKSNILRFTSKFNETELTKATAKAVHDVVPDKLDTAQLKGLGTYVDVDIE
jgi:Uncharacterized protein involved in cytokinesis, contains TGc (transglutaminase/protease-like) domain